MKTYLNLLMVIIACVTCNNRATNFTTSTDTTQQSILQTKENVYVDTISYWIALNQQAGWIVTIAEDKYVNYIGNFGKDTLRFEYMGKNVNQRRILFKTYRGENSIQVEFYKDSCNGIAQQKYPYRALVNVSGALQLQGCGEFKQSLKTTHE